MKLPNKLSGLHIALLIVAILILLVLIFILRPEKKLTLRQLTPPQVVVEEARAQALHPSRTVTGELRPQRHAELRFEVAGLVRQREVQAGTVVEKGQSLMRLDAADFEDDLLLAKSRLKQEQEAVARDRVQLKLARESRELQEAELKRLETLGQDMASRTRIGETRQRLLQLATDEARLQHAVNTAEARLQERRVAVNQAQRRLERSRLPAPFDGVVNRLDDLEGERVTTNQIVGELIDIAGLELQTQVDPASSRALQTGMHIEVTVNGHTLQGTLTALALDPGRKTYTQALRIRVQGEDLRPGMLATAQLPLGEQQDVLVVPVEALLPDEGAFYLFILQGDKLERRPVTPGLREGQRQIILAGLQAGERYVARDVAALADGQQVRIHGEPQEPAAETPVEVEAESQP